MDRGNNNQIIAIDERRNQDIRRQYDNDLRIDTSAYPEDDYDDEIDLKKLLATVLRRKKIIIFATLLLALLSWLYTLSIVPVYRATTTIKIDQTSDKLAHYDDVLEEKNTNVYTFQQTQYSLLKSRKLAQRVISKLEIENKKDSLNTSASKSTTEKPQPGILTKIRKTARSFSQSISAYFTDGKTQEFAAKTGQLPHEMSFISNLQVAPQKSSSLVKVHYYSNDPQFAAAAVNTLASEYITMNLEDILSSSTYAKTYLTEQIALTKGRLEASEKRLVDYAKEKKIINADTSKSLVSEALDSLNQAYTIAQQELIAAESEYRQRNQVTGDIRTMDNAIITALKTKQSELSTQYKKDLQTYKPAFPAMIEIKKQINEIQRQIKAESLKIRSNSQNDFKTRFFAAKEKEQMLGQKLELKKSELLTQRDKSIGYTILQREVETNRQLYNNLLQRMKEIGIAGGVVSNNISVIDEAFVPHQKHTPNTRRNVMLGTLLGLMLGLAIALLRENQDDTIKDVEELKGFNNLPVLGIFPYIKNKGKEAFVQLPDSQYTLESEAFRSLLTNLEYLDSNGLPHILHITSASPGEGKSNTAINMALILADNNKKVLLIDADLRKPKVGAYLEVKNTSGLADYLVNKVDMDEVIIESETPNLSVITAGASAPSPAKLLADNRLLELLEYGGNQFDHIIIDSPPLLGLADSLILANRSDATLFAVACEETRKAHLADALDRLKMGYGNVVGFVLTKSKSSKNDYYSYDNYYGGYGISKEDQQALKLQYG